MRPSSRNRTVRHVSRTVIFLMIGGVCVGGLGGCSSPKPIGSVSESQMKGVRSSFSSLRTGVDRDQALAGFAAGNRVKLGSAVINGVAVEEWKAEAIREKKPRNDIFITFLYFCDDRLVDVSDTRVDFRGNPQLVEQWTHAGK